MDKYINRLAKAANIFDDPIEDPPDTLPNFKDSLYQLVGLM